MAIALERAIQLAYTHTLAAADTVADLNAWAAALGYVGDPLFQMGDRDGANLTQMMAYDGLYYFRPILPGDILEMTPNQVNVYPQGIGYGKFKMPLPGGWPALGRGSATITVALLLNATLDVQVPLTPVMPSTDYQAAASLTAGSGVLGSLSIVGVPAGGKTKAACTVRVKAGLALAAGAGVIVDVVALNT